MHREDRKHNSRACASPNCDQYQRETRARTCFSRCRCHPQAAGTCPIHSVAKNTRSHRTFAKPFFGVNCERCGCSSGCFVERRISVDLIRRCRCSRSSLKNQTCEREGCLLSKEHSAPNKASQARRYHQTSSSKQSKGAESNRLDDSSVFEMLSPSPNPVGPSLNNGSKMINTEFEYDCEEEGLLATGWATIVVNRVAENFEEALKETRQNVKVKAQESTFRMFGQASQPKNDVSKMDICVSDKGYADVILASCYVNQADATFTTALQETKTVGQRVGKEAEEGKSSGLISIKIQNPNEEQSPALSVDKSPFKHAKKPPKRRTRGSKTCIGTKKPGEKS